MSQCKKEGSSGDGDDDGDRLVSAAVDDEDDAANVQNLDDEEDDAIENPTLHGLLPTSRKNTCIDYPSLSQQS